MKKSELKTLIREVLTESKSELEYSNSDKNLMNDRWKKALATIYTIIQIAERVGDKDLYNKLRKIQNELNKVRLKSLMGIGRG